MSKLTTFFWACLLATCAGFAWNNTGLVKYDGLFLLDMEGKRVSVWGMHVGDSVQVRNWTFTAGLDYIHYNFFLFNEGESVEETWTLDSKGSLSIGNVSISKDFEFFGLDVKVSSLPSVTVSSRFYLPDSLFFARASMGKGLLDLSGLHWKSEWDEDYVPEIDGTFRSIYLMKDFNAGIRLKEHLLQGGFAYGADMPSLDDRWGYVFSDSSHFWGTRANYLYQGQKNEFEALYAYLYADLRLFALTREDGSEVNEKRFAYFPLGIDFNLFKLAYRYKFDRGDALKANLLYATLEMNIPWENRRFYETLAPNKALKNSVLRTLSFSVFQRTFRIYGDIDGKLFYGGLGYEWNLPLSRWHMLLNTDVDYFYGSYEGKLNLRKEKAGMFYMTHQTGFWEKEGYLFGIVAGLELQVQTPSRKFFAGLRLNQIVPLGMKFESKMIEKEPVIIDVPPPEPPPVDPGVIPVVEEETADDMEPLSSLIFRNGFFLGIEVGFWI